MTVKLLSAYNGIAANTIVNLDQATEAALVSQLKATTTLTGGAVYAQNNPFESNPIGSYTFATLPNAANFAGQIFNTTDLGSYISNGTAWVSIGNASVMNRPVMVSVIGDSITAHCVPSSDLSLGSVAASYTNSARAHFARSWIIYGSMRSSYAWAPFEYIIGFSGATTATILANCLPALLNYPNGQPDACVVLAGTNDIGGTVSVTTALANVKAMWLGLQAAGIAPIAATIPPTINSPYKCQQFNIGIQRMALELKIPCIDFYSALVNSTTGFWANASYTDDNTHPSPAGAAAMGYVMNQTLTTWLKPITRSLMPDFIDQPINITMTGTAPTGATSATLTAPYAGETLAYTFKFSSGEYRFGNLVSGSTAMTWSPALTNNSTNSSVIAFPPYQLINPNFALVTGTIDTASSFPSSPWGAPGTTTMSKMNSAAGAEPGTGLTMLQKLPTGVNGLAAPVYSGNSWTVSGDGANTLSVTGPPIVGLAGDKIAVSFRIKLIMNQGAASPGSGQFALLAGGRTCAGFCYLSAGVNWATGKGAQIGSEATYFAGDFYQEITLQAIDAPKLTPSFTLNCLAGGLTNAGDSITVSNLRVINLTASGLYAP